MQKLIILLSSILVFTFSSCSTQTDSPLSKENECNVSAGAFRTQTQASWGAKPNRSNAAKFLADNFVAVFPQGLTIGCKNGYRLSLSSAQAVEDFLPQGGTTAILTQNHTDPKESISILSGQLVAATINVEIDEAFATFSASTTPVGSLIITNGALAGMSIDQLIYYANRVLGDCSTDYSPAILAAELNHFNQNFHEGKFDNHYLACPNED